MRSLYDQYLQCLADKNLISPDDLINYSSIFPLFKPVYVFYDEEKSFYAGTVQYIHTLSVGKMDSQLLLTPVERAGLIFHIFTLIVVI